MSDLIERLRATRDCSVCEGDGIKFNGKVCGGCQGTGRVTRFGSVGIEAADAIASKDREIAELRARTASQQEIAAAWGAWHSRHGGKLGPGAAFVEAINAAFAIRSLGKEGSGE